MQTGHSFASPFVSLQLLLWLASMFFFLAQTSKHRGKARFFLLLLLRSETWNIYTAYYVSSFASLTHSFTCCLLKPFRTESRLGPDPVLIRTLHSFLSFNSRSSSSAPALPGKNLWANHISWNVGLLWEQTSNSWQLDQ